VSVDVAAYMKERAAAVDAALDRFLPAESVRPERLHTAMRYSVFAGGKRLRPVLVIAGAEAVGGRMDDVMPTACAMEMIHTYSLVHDDLPCMDDDDLRRGRATVHKAFDEPTALLVGDGLQSLAFRHLLAAGDPRAAPLASLLAHNAWRMVQGQALDMDAQGRALTESEVLELMAGKTGALITAAVVGGAIAASGSPSGLEPVGQRLGLAFQIADDLLDLTGDAATLGKRVGKDQAAGKATLPALVGVDEARRRADTACDEALAALAPLGAPAEALRALARFVVTRKR
jgi:farnesyl diphosphate synthase/geranylgeranyl diphosphate synthase type II